LDQQFKAMVAFTAHIFEDRHGVLLLHLFAIIENARVVSQCGLGDGMPLEEKSFVFRISLEAGFPDDYDGDSEEYAWLRDWEQRIKPELIRSLFETLRQYPSWTVHVRNRGKSPADEIEVAMIRDFSKPELP
jgi:hypothetical protein